jgi:hypothetical protein
MWSSIGCAALLLCGWAGTGSTAAQNPLAPQQLEGDDWGHDLIIGSGLMQQ